MAGDTHENKLPDTEDQDQAKDQDQINAQQTQEAGTTNAPDGDGDGAEPVADAPEAGNLEHSVGGQTTRSDASDLGVPMLPGDPNEPVGPEDALGPGPKRGDYRNRIGPANYNPSHTRPATDAKPGDPTIEVLDQRAATEDIGEVAKKKGGVDSADS